MRPMTQAERNKIASILEYKINPIVCPMCHKQNFSLVDGYIVTPIQNEPDTLVIGGNRSIVAVAIICVNCGYTSHHNIKALGIQRPESTN